jgi:hypothetical protein
MVEYSVGRRLLDFYRLSYKVGKCLRLNSLMWGELDVESPKLDCPLG